MTEHVPIIDSLFAGQRRTKGLNGFIVLGDWFPIIPALLLVFAYYSGHDNRWPPLLWTTVGTVILTGSSKTLKHYKDKRDKELASEKQTKDKDEIQRLRSALEEATANHTIKIDEMVNKLEESFQEGVARGADIKMSHWAEVARLHEAGMVSTHRQLADRIRTAAAGDVDTECITSYLQAVLAGFRTFYPDTPEAPLDITASLAVVTTDRNTVNLVKIYPGGRGRTRQLPRPCDVSTLTWGMSEMLHRNQDTVYTADVRTLDADPDRGYLSVANLAVRDINGLIVAIVNVDSPTLDTFVSLERVQQAYQYCLPILSSLSLSLADRRMFRGERA